MIKNRKNIRAIGYNRLWMMSQVVGAVPPPGPTCPASPSHRGCQVLEFGLYGVKSLEFERVSGFGTRAKIRDIFGGGFGIRAIGSNRL